MKIRKSRPADLPILLGLYEQARAFMAAHGNPTQWGNTDPPAERVEQDIREGCSYVCEEDQRIIATFYFRMGEDHTYRVIHEGAWLNDTPYGVVHRITSDGTVRGTGSFCLNWAFSQCGNLRIDTHQDNTVMRSLLAKNGFVQCGVIITDNGTSRLAFQKVRGPQ